MVDEYEETGEKEGVNKDTARTQAAMTGQGDKANDNSQRRRRRRRRRSLFSLLFASNNQQANGESSQDEESAASVVKIPQKEEKELTPNSREAKQGHKRRNQDVVLIKPREARCVEATVVSLVSENKHDNSAATPDQLRGAKVNETRVAPNGSKRAGRAKRAKSEDQKNTLQSLVRRRMRKFQASKSRDEDADSYILDLNDCLSREKLRVSSSSSSETPSSTSSSSSSLSSSLGNAKSRAQKSVEDAKEFSPLREISPIEDKWQTNEEYIPSVRDGLNNNIAQRQLQVSTKKRPEAQQAARRQQKSPLLREFLESHQIKLRASGDSLDAKRTTSPPSHSESSSCDTDDDEDAAGPCSGWSHKRPTSRDTARLPPVSYFDELNAGSLAASKINELSESDRRLYHWRRLAARSVTMWQVPDESSSDEDDSDLGDFIDCQSPARVCYCSDDTSCSSVELIWSRPSGPLAQNPMVPAVRVRQASATPPPPAPPSHTERPLHSLATPTPPTSTDLNLSPGRSNSRSPTPQRLQVYNSHLTHRFSSNNKPASSNNSLKSVSSQSISCQRPSIFELAKPSRARDRKIGPRDRNNNDDRHRPRRTRDHRSPATRRSMPAPLVSRDSASPSNEKTRERSLAPVSRSASGTDWHPNPLFGRLAEKPDALGEQTGAGPRDGASPLRTSLKNQKQARSCDDERDESEGAATKLAPRGARQSLRRHLSVDLQHQQKVEQAQDERMATGNNTKSSRLRSFLARLKRQDATKSSEQVDCEQKREPEEGLDEFDVENATSGFQGDRNRRQRWSLRMRSPFTATNSNNNYNDYHQTGENHAYLSHLVNLDKRIKSNMASFKSQLGERLSGTSKRASVLADQLITSIKDTTKEQLLLATTGTPARDRYDSLPNSFVSAPSEGTLPVATTNADPLLVRKQLITGAPDGYNTNDRRAKMFSLIYMHQQQQATGRNVITRQPTSGRSRPVSSSRIPSTTSGKLVNDPDLLSSKPASPTAAHLDNEQTQPQVDLDKLLDPKELLFVRFKTLKGRAQTEVGAGGHSMNTYQRLSKTIAPRDRDLVREALKSSPNEPKRRSSCTV